MLGVPALLEVAPDVASRELEPGLDRPCHGLLPGATGLAPFFPFTPAPVPETSIARDGAPKGQEVLVRLVDCRMCW
jgi:hypothetical protein